VRETIVQCPIGPVESGCFSRLTLALAVRCLSVLVEVACEYIRSGGVSVIN
jgi:hypothetical protein